MPMSSGRTGGGRERRGGERGGEKGVGGRGEGVLVAILCVSYYTPFYSTD